MAGKHRGQPSEAEYSLEMQDRRLRVSEQREARFQRAQQQRESRQSASPRSRGSGGTDWHPGRFAQTVTMRGGTYSGKGTLAALLLVGFVIVAIRLVADAEVQDDGTTVKANVMHPQGELGPIPILAALIATFFVLSFVAVGGGLRAKLAVIMAGAIILTLGVRSLPEIKTVAGTFGKIGTIVAPAPTGTLSSIFGDQGSGGAPGALGGLAGAPLSSIGKTPGEIASTDKPPTSIKNLGQDALNALKEMFAGGIL